jgi:predicted DsbA family dithiol-disulfide isomerase
VLREQRLASWTPAKREAACRRVEKAGAAAGITFRDGGRVGPTQDAHRLLHSLRGRRADSSRLAEDGEEEEGVQEKLVEGLFSAFHEQERDISDRGVLREIGIAAGMTPEEIDHAFSSVEIAEEFEAEAAKYREFVAGTGVPVFIIQGQHRIDGAQDPMEFVEAFIKVKEAEAAKVAAA